MAYKILFFVSCPVAQVGISFLPAKPAAVGKVTAGSSQSANKKAHHLRDRLFLLWSHQDFPTTLRVSG